VGLNNIDDGKLPHKLVRCRHAKERSQPSVVGVLCDDQLVTAACCVSQSISQSVSQCGWGASPRCCCDWIFVNRCWTTLSMRGWPRRVFCESRLPASRRLRSFAASCFARALAAACASIRSRSASRRRASAFRNIPLRSPVVVAAAAADDRCCCCWCWCCCGGGWAAVAPCENTCS